MSAPAPFSKYHSMTDDELSLALTCKARTSPASNDDCLAMDAAADRIEALTAKLVEARDRLKGLRELCGYVQDGSDTKVRISQDDATREWIVQVGKDWYHDSYFLGAIDRAIAENNPHRARGGYTGGVWWNSYRSIMLTVCSL